ncbi:MAG: T9SS type A sorting domain-containing protein [Bacteroidales bacterium]|nr:T9SS type A sorting domain-containing protein [Bacteroidales bacterium]
MENSIYITKIKNAVLLVCILFVSFALNAQTGLWEGSVDDDWQTSANWTNNTVPDSTVDVTIPSASTYYPSIDNSGDSCKSMIVKDGATLTMCTGGSLNVKGNLTVGEGSSGVLNAGSGCLVVTGQLILNAGSSVTISGCGITCASANLNTSSTVTYAGSNMDMNNWNYGNLILNGTGTMQITGDATTPTTCNNLTINNTGNVLKIPVNKALTVSGTLTNNVGTSGIVLESTSSGDGSLIISTSNVNATVERYITGNRWHYLSPPIDAAPLTLFNTNNFLWWDATMEWSGSGDYDPWKSYSSSNLTNAQGYAYYYYEDTIEYKGNMNVGDYAVTLYKSETGALANQGWNLIGNPYTSVLDWDALVADGSIPAGAENAIYLFDDDDGTGAQGNYRYYVPSTGGTYSIGTENATGIIPLGQGFFIKTNTNNVTLNIKKDYRAHSNQEFYKSFENEYIKLKIENELSDETIIRVVKNSTFGFDSQFDARKLFPDDAVPQLFCLDEENILTAISSIPEIDKNTVINLGIKAEEGNYKITLKDLNYFSCDVYLIDNYIKSEINLSKKESYKFFHSGEQVDDRFYLTFQSSATDINNNFDLDISIYPNPTGSFIKFSNKSNLKFESIQINSLNGSTCYKNNEVENIDRIDLSDFSEGIYFIQIKLSDGNTYNNKIILQK